MHMPSQPVRHPTFGLRHQPAGSCSHPVPTPPLPWRPNPAARPPTPRPQDDPNRHPDKGTAAISIDLDKCIKCERCVAACGFTQVRRGLLDWLGIFFVAMWVWVGVGEEGGAKCRGWSQEEDRGILSEGVDSIAPSFSPAPAAQPAAAAAALLRALPRRA